MSAMPRQLGDVGPHQLGAQRAVQADGERLGMAHRVPERLHRLARERAAGEVGDGAGDPDRQLERRRRRTVEDRLDRGLGVQRVEDGLDQEEVDAALVQRPRLLAIGRDRPASKVTLRAPGSFTSGEIESVRLVGPMEPATKRGLSGVFAVQRVGRLAREPAPRRGSVRTAMSASP